MTKTTVPHARIPRNDLTAEYVRACLDYCPETGVLTWRVRLWKRPRINSAVAGKPAGCVNPRGYVVVSIDDVSYRAHRVAWLHYYGEWPKLHIDHIDGNTRNNAINNLREADTSHNNMNAKKSVRNTSGVKGVRYDCRRDMWEAYVSVDKKFVRLGMYESLEQAAAVRAAVATSVYGEFYKYG